MSAYEEWLALYPDGHPPTREDGTFDEGNFYRGRIADLTAERDAALGLASNTAQQLVMCGNAVSELREKESDLMHRCADLIAERDTALRDAEQQAGEIEGLITALRDAGRCVAVGYGLPGCPVCGHDMGEPHADDCFIGTALAAAAGRGADGEAT